LYPGLALATIEVRATFQGGMGEHREKIEMRNHSVNVRYDRQCEAMERSRRQCFSRNILAWTRRDMSRLDAASRMRQILLIPTSALRTKIATIRFWKEVV
jgi:hypothetical protein